MNEPDEAPGTRTPELTRERGQTTTHSVRALRRSGLRRETNKPKTSNSVTGCVVLVLALIAVILCCQTGIARSWVQGVAAEDDASNAAATAAAQPTATETPGQRVYRIIKDGLDTCQIQNIVVKGNAITVNLNHCSHARLSDVRDGLQQDIFDSFLRIYTSHLQPATVTVNAYGAVYDKYGNASTALYATATLASPTAAKFSWDNLSTAQAWSDYDKAWMRDDIANA